MRLIISEEEKKSILSLHSSYGYKAFINEQDLTPSRPEGPQDEPQGLEHGIGQIETVDVLADKSTRYMLGVVKDKDGNPIPNVKITVTDKNGNNVFTHTTSAGTETKINRVVTTNDKGEFKILGLTTEDSPYTLMGELDGYTTINKKFRKGDEVVKMDLTMEKKPEPPKPEETETPPEETQTPPEETQTPPEETSALSEPPKPPKPPKPLSKRSMERLNSKVYGELVKELKKENLVFTNTNGEPLQLDIDKGKSFSVDYNPAIVTIPTKNPKTNLPSGKIMFDCNMSPVILMRMGEEAYKKTTKYNGNPYYEINMPSEYGNDWIKINYCDRLVSRTNDGKIVAPYDKR